MRISDWSSDVCSSDLPALSSGRTPAGRTWPRLQPHRLQDREGSGVAGSTRADERMRMGESSMRKTLFAAMAVAGLCLAAGLPAFGQLNDINRSGLDLTPEDWDLMENEPSTLYMTEEAPAD